jgi:hypothetical protein
MFSPFVFLNQVSDDASNSQISSWLSEQRGPVVIIHHETPSDAHFMMRYLANSTSSSVTPLTEFEIAQYQVMATCF